MPEANEVTGDLFLNGMGEKRVGSRQVYQKKRSMAIRKNPLSIIYGFTGQFPCAA